jgi:hypothetical protein
LGRRTRRSARSATERRWQSQRRAQAHLAVLGPVLQDVTNTLRELRRSPLLVVGVVGTFAVGLGAAGLTFDLLDRTFLRLPPDLGDSERVQRVAFIGGDYSGFVRCGECVTSACLPNRIDELNGTSRVFATWSGCTLEWLRHSTGNRQWLMRVVRPAHGGHLIVLDARPSA